MKAGLRHDDWHGQRLLADLSLGAHVGAAGDVAGSATLPRMLARNLIVAVLALLCTVPVANAAPGKCATIALPSELPDRAVCSALGGTSLMVDVTVDAQVDSFIDAARTDIAQSRLDEADARLDCAAATLVRAGVAQPSHRLLRTQGSLAYARVRMPDALAYLECALAISAAGENRLTEASDLNAVGSTLRRMGDFSGALRALSRSLDMQRTAGDVSGAVLNNIADVYRDLGEPNEALHHYGQAQQAFLDRGDEGHAAHVLESMAVVVLETGDTRQASDWLKEVLETYRTQSRHAFVLRVYGWLIRVALVDGDLDVAQRWKSEGLATAERHRLPLPSSFQLQAARTERLFGEPRIAAARLRAALDEQHVSDEETAALHEELAAAEEASGNFKASIASLRRARLEESLFDRARYDRQLSWLRTRFETAERDRTIAALESDNQLRRAEVRQRTLLLGLTIALAMAALLSGWLLLQRRRQREQLWQAAQLARKEGMLARYRREADALAEDRQLLQALLDAQDDAICLLNADGRVLAVNGAASRLLVSADEDTAGKHVVDYLQEADRARLTAALEQMEDTATQELSLAREDGGVLCARLSQWPHGDGQIVLELSPPAQQTPAVITDSPKFTTDGNSEAAMREAFRRLLVELMLTTIDAWERSTGSDRLELAENSRIWRVAIDDGRLRARSMERYLSVARLPKNPRWRDVLRTTYYVLENCSMAPEMQSGLEDRVDAVLAYTRRSALF